jgi:hypothetical protein
MREKVTDYVHKCKTDMFLPIGKSRDDSDAISMYVVLRHGAAADA